MLVSQAGPFAACVFFAVPTCLEFMLDSTLFRVLLHHPRVPLACAGCVCGRPPAGWSPFSLVGRSLRSTPLLVSVSGPVGQAACLPLPCRGANLPGAHFASRCRLVVPVLKARFRQALTAAPVAPGDDEAPDPRIPPCPFVLAC